MLVDVDVEAIAVSMSVNRSACMVWRRLRELLRRFWLRRP